MDRVFFKEGTQAQYDAIPIHDSSTVYWVKQPGKNYGKIYKGNTPYSINLDTDQEYVEFKQQVSNKIDNLNNKIDEEIKVPIQEVTDTSKQIIYTDIYKSLYINTDELNSNVIVTLPHEDSEIPVGAWFQIISGTFSKGYFIRFDGNIKGLSQTYESGKYPYLQFTVDHSSSMFKKISDTQWEIVYGDPFDLYSKVVDKSVTFTLPYNSQNIIYNIDTSSNDVNVLIDSASKFVANSEVMFFNNSGTINSPNKLLLTLENSTETFLQVLGKTNSIEVIPFGRVIIKRSADSNNIPIWMAYGDIVGKIPSNQQFEDLEQSIENLDQQLNPEIQGSLASTVGNIEEKIGTDETEGSILGRISALESGGSEWEEVNFSDIDFTFSANTDWVTYRKAWLNASCRMIMICFAMSTSSFSYETTNSMLGSFSEGSEYIPLPSKNNGMFTSAYTFQDGTSNEIKCSDVAIGGGGQIMLGGDLQEGHRLFMNITMMYAY